MLIAPLLLFSCVTNAAILVSPIFMMQVLDRVVPSGNLNTLLLLLGLALAAMTLNSFVETNRDLTIQRVARWAEGACTGPILRLPPAKQNEMLQHLSAMRNFLTSGHAVALLNLCWLPMFLFALALINVNYVLLVVALLAVILLTQASRDGLLQVAWQEVGALKSTETRWIKLLETLGSIRPPEHVRTNLNERVIQTQGNRHETEAVAETRQLTFKSVLSLIRVSAQLLALSLGAYLVSQGRLSAGAMIAASLITARVVTSAEQAIEAVKAWPDAKQALGALQMLPDAHPAQTDVSSLSGKLKVEGLIYPRGGGAPPRLDRISFELEPGACLAIIGDAGSGKSTLLNALAGLDPAPIGAVTLDQTDVRHMDALMRHRHIGLMQQLGGLLPGTVAENIAGFSSKIDDAAVVAAAKKAKVHGMVSGLPEGYQTDIGQHPHLLTAGQKQHVALAAAFYSRPRYLLLDEPNALLDKNGERAMCEALAAMKDEGVTVVMVLHRAGVIGLADHVLVMQRGAVADFGPRAQVLGRQNDGRRITRMPLRTTSLQDLSDWIAGQFTRADDAEFASKATMLGTEMFLAANLNGPQDHPREVEVQFRFVNDTCCELQLVEQGTTNADKLLRQVKVEIEKGRADFQQLGEKAAPLFLAQKLAEQFEIRNENNLAQFSARLLSDEPALSKGRPN
ncbi:ATP-binding cassette domain-containing protein [Actibacterium mucosum]|nr:ATP-binding cassette domain-containing protein [Actibacterium mucosum]